MIQPMISGMSGLLEAGPVFAVTGLLADIGLNPSVLVIALICAGLGTFILSRHTYQLGFFTYPLNFCVLFAGAVAANLLLQDVRLPVTSTMERVLIISIGGMVVVSLVTMILMPRDRQSG
jgi:hypothetical protein